jgi:hypothetical protein
MATQRTDPEVRVTWALLGSGLVLLLIRWIRLRGRGPVIGPVGTTPVVAARNWRCTNGSIIVEGSCADGWWDHWWNGLPYCDESQATCEMYGGRYESIN